MLLFLLFATISAHTLRSASMVEQMYLDPVAFAQSFENASPEAVRSVMSMIDDLIAEGAGKREALIKDHEDAVAATAAADAARQEALDELEHATGKRIEGDEKVTALEGTLAQKQSAEATAVTNKNNAESAFNTAQAWMDTEVARVDGEKTALEEVLQILADLPTGRRLLSAHGSLVPVGMIAAAAKSDPAAVAEVVGLVNDLIATGEGVRESVTGARDDAQGAYKDATTQWKWAVARTVDAQDNLADAEAEVQGLLGVEATKKKTHVEKRDIHEAAEQEEAEKKKLMDEQVPILDHEETQLKRVNEILGGLL